MIKAGYDPNGMITFFNKNSKGQFGDGTQIPAYLLNHPALENRISLLENLLQMGPKPTGPFKTFGNFKRIQTKAFVEEREPDVAVTHFQSLIDANPQDLEGYYGLGLAYRKMGRLDKSMEVFQNAHSLAPKDPDLFRELGIVYFLSGKVDQAIENLEAIRSTSEEGQDNDLMTLYYLGRGYQEKGDFAKALPLFLKVQKEEPEFIDVYHHLGSVYGRMGQKGLSHFYFGKYFKLKGEKECPSSFQNGFRMVGEGRSGEGRSPTRDQRTYAQNDENQSSLYCPSFVKGGGRILELFSEQLSG